MKRDMDLIRMIILGARETPNGSPLMGVPGVADETFAEHVIKPSASWTFGVLLEYLKVEIRRHIPGLD